MHNKACCKLAFVQHAAKLDSLFYYETIWQSGLLPDIQKLWWLFHISAAQYNGSLFAANLNLYVLTCQTHFIKPQKWLLNIQYFNSVDCLVWGHCNNLFIASKFKLLNISSNILEANWKDIVESTVLQVVIIIHYCSKWYQYTWWTPFLLARLILQILVCYSHC